MDRRDFLRAGAAAALGGSFTGAYFGQAWSGASGLGTTAPLCEFSQRPPSASIIPVVGDGKWIWTKPPEKRGYLEPWPYLLKVGILMHGTGPATRIQAQTAAPVEHPEQKVEDFEIDTRGCQATLRELRPGAAQLCLRADRLQAGQTISAIATYKLTLHKQYQGFDRDRFPYTQKVPPEITKSYLQSSPGIETASREVQELAAELCQGALHPWEKAEKFAQWVPQNIEARIGPYTNVVTALKKRVGDCEERSATFVALCRAVGIPARLVWVPNHNWAEFYLTDQDGQGHWIPAHTSCYSWFGWVGAHELVIQKGDRVFVPERKRQFRLLEDWAQWAGAKPQVRYVAEIAPLPPEENADAGPGARTKDAKGEWVIVGDHPANKYLRR